MKRCFRFCISFFSLACFLVPLAYGSTKSSTPRFSINTGLATSPRSFGIIGTEWAYNHIAVNFGIGNFNSPSHTCENGCSSKFDIFRGSFGIRRYDNRDKASIGFNIGNIQFVNGNSDLKRGILTLGYKFKLDKYLHLSAYSGFDGNLVSDIENIEIRPYFGINVGYDL
jgi:hypothetical protein